MPRTAKPKPTPATESNTITVAAAAEQLGATEQALRLALIDIRPDDFDTVKTLPLLDFEAVTKKIKQQQQPQLPATDSHTAETPENSETITQQAIQPATEPANFSENINIVRQQPQQQLPTPQTPAATNRLTLIEQLAKQASEEIAAVDALSQVKNQLILNNLSVRQSELTEEINQRWQAQKTEYLGCIRDLTNLAQQQPEYTSDPVDLGAEVDSFITELGKKLSA